MSGTSASGAIDATDLARRFGASWVLRGITLRVAPGEVVGLLGANGTGKSTLLRIVATLLRPHAGTLHVCGEDAVARPARARAAIGYLAHLPGLYDDLTARENLLFTAAMLDRPRDDVDAVLDRVGLAAFAAERVRGFSSGMQRRLAIARLALRQPRVVLLDEPYANLDAAGVELMNSFIAEWVEADVAALIVLHEVAPANSVLDRTVTIVDGRVVPKASPELHRRSGASLKVSG